MRLYKSIAASLMCGALFASAAWAAQIKILDGSGNTRSIVELAQGSAGGSVKVTLSGTETLSGVQVSLIDNATNSVIQTVFTDGSGMANFANVAPGTFRYSVGNQLLTVANVEIIDAAARAQLGGAAGGGLAGGAGGAGAGAGIAGGLGGIGAGGAIAGGAVVGGAAVGGTVSKGQQNSSSSARPRPIPVASGS